MADVRYTTAIIDDFNRPDENPIQLPWKRDWASRIDMELNNNAVGSPNPSPSSGASAYWSTQNFSGDDIEAWSTTAGNANIQDSFQIGLWTSGTPSGYELHIPNPVGADTWQLWRYVAGVTNQLASVLHAAPAVGTMVRINTNATHLQAWESLDAGANWTLIVQVATTQFRSNLYIMLGARGGGPGWDNVGGGVPTTFMGQYYRRVPA